MHVFYICISIIHLPSPTRIQLFGYNCLFHSIGAATGFDASELITQREVVSQKVQESLVERGQTFVLVLDDISIRVAGEDAI